jgi:hypothetical protein
MGDLHKIFLPGNEIARLIRFGRGNARTFLAFYHISQSGLSRISAGRLSGGKAKNRYFRRWRRIGFKLIANGNINGIDGCGVRVGIGEFDVVSRRRAEDGFQMFREFLIGRIVRP